MIVELDIIFILTATQKYKVVAMPRAKIWGYAALTASLSIMIFMLYSVFYVKHDYPTPVDLTEMNNMSFYFLAMPLTLLALFVLATGFWIGWTILTIKVVPPMPEIVEKQDHSKIKAFFLCIITLAAAMVLLYGLYIKSYWALAIPAAAVSLVVLGAVFWVGIAIITTRSTLPK